MFVIKNKNFFLGFSVVLTAIAVAAIFIFGIKAGIDFTGGSLLEVEYSATRPDQSAIKSQLANVGFADATVQQTGDKGFIIRTKSLDEKGHAVLMGALAGDVANAPVEKRFTSIGPVIGNELRAKAWVAVLSVILAIVLYIAFAFRKVSAPVSSSKYGIIAIMALLHDVLVPLGVLAFLSHYIGVEADVLFITALLTILGFSVHDTIVVFDRVRENLKLKVSSDFAKTVGLSINQTLVRSINTSLTVVLVLSALLFFGPQSTYYFSLILLIGIISGTYSSIFIASPLLVVVEEMQRKRKPSAAIASEQTTFKKKKKKDR
jgi:preprotein translocase subunit SecF